ncbi:spore germination protein [Bacillus xiapuensis]|uniref:spore germination protein n=1 Tax=Bacillus xiapuensis TaxID=2014075 RepID=UPI000C2310CB|nr:spore germination protein [Bacillus xiapuensis]
MPAIVGTVTVINVSSSGVFNVGDVFQIHPVAQTKTFSGAGSFNTGHGLSIYSGTSHSMVYDGDVLDQLQIGNL